MDYEKAYNEALKRAEELSKKEGLAEGTILHKEVLEYIFPELAESEDEKTRKELIEFVKSHLAGFSECDRFIAWLEKQGEQKSVEYQIDYMSELTPFENTFHSIATKYTQNLQKEEYRQPWYTKERAAEMLCNAMKQEPEWSEEDEAMYNRIVRSYTSYEGRIQIAKDLSEDNRDNILKDLSEQELWLRDRLKSLRPQPHWKPSEKQIEALADSIENHCYTPILEELLEQLKAL